MPDFVRRLFDTDFIPHGHCYFWRADVVWLHVVSDLLITIAYYSIPIALAVFLRRRRDIPFGWMFWMFGGFIFACGTTHLLNVWTVWVPFYRLDGAVKLLTAILSVTTAILLWRLIPRAMALPSPAQLAAANRDLESFAYSVSHDLRAPLRSIDGFAEMLAQESGDRLDPDGRDHLQRIRAASQRMGHLIDALLDLSRLSRAEMRRERVDLSLLARAVSDDLLKAEPARRVEVRVADGAVAQGDERLLRVLLQNLIGNAWKFTRGRPVAHIEFGKAQKDGRTSYFVRDDGAGFEMAYVHKLFGPFQRLHSAGDFEGTGIGLATVARIVQRHGGRVWAEGAVDRGATFFFSL